MTKTELQTQLTELDINQSIIDNLITRFDAESGNPSYFDEIMQVLDTAQAKIEAEFEAKEKELNEQEERLAVMLNKKDEIIANTMADKGEENLEIKTKAETSQPVEQPATQMIENLNQPTPVQVAQNIAHANVEAPMAASQNITNIQIEEQNQVQTPIPIQPAQAPVVDTATQIPVQQPQFQAQPATTQSPNLTNISV